MSKSYRILVFGKPDCDKCALLNQRIDNLIAGREWQDFDKEYCDLETEEGLIRFAEAECINPQQIPAMLVTRFNKHSGRYELIPNPRPGEFDSVCRKSKLHQFLGLRTDYSETGRGVISPEMITAVLNESQAP